MPLIALITDWSHNDYYLGALKGYIYSVIPEANIVEITNTISNYSIFQAAFVLKSCFNNFAAETVFIIGVKTVVNNKNKYLCFKYQNKYILTSDNGFFSIFTDDKPESVYCFDDDNSTFPEKDVFAKVACKILKNENLNDFAKKIDIFKSNGYRIEKNLHSVANENSITGHVIYIDNYGNVITNITKEQFIKYRNNRKFIIYPGSTEFPIDKISETYLEDDDNIYIALFNSLELLEIAVINSSATQLFNIEVKSNIRIEFYDTTSS